MARNSRKQLLLYREILSSEADANLARYYEHCENNLLRTALFKVALDNERGDVLLHLARTYNGCFSPEDIIDCAKHRQYSTVFKILQKKVGMLKSDIINRLILIFYQNFYYFDQHKHNSHENILYLQKILKMFYEQRIKIYNYKSFCDKLVSLYDNRVKRAKRVLFEETLRLVVCNPKHPVGYRCILKEYNEYNEGCNYFN